MTHVPTKRAFLAPMGLIKHRGYDHRPVFLHRCSVVAKYAYTAQHEGIVLRNNPLKLAPYRDFVQSHLACRIRISLSRRQRKASGLVSFLRGPAEVAGPL